MSHFGRRLSLRQNTYARVDDTGDTYGMQFYFCCAIAALLLYLAIWRPVFLKKKFPAISFGLCLLVLGIFSWQEFKWQRMEWQGTQAVKEVSLNKDGHLKCQRLSEALFDVNTTRAGSVSSDHPNMAVVNYEQCIDLMGWLNSDKKSVESKQVQALHVLTHEAVHVSGEYNEAVTECTAINRDSITVKELGGEPDVAAQVATDYYKEFFPRMPSRYKLPDCTILPEFDSVLMKSKSKVHG